ncbi:MAG: hypothetical protein DYH20_05345 [Gammaproteobacteria bacterium PRO9]|nr:hypothetical protein [Gammaproteobacteria bacterium PRO9]
MIPNLINFVIGLVLVYLAIFSPESITSGVGPLVIAAVVIFVLAFLARRSDHHPWQNTVNMGLAVILAGATMAQLAGLPSAEFWGAIWIGIAVSMLALWAALYKPQPQAQGSGNHRH